MNSTHSQVVALTGATGFVGSHLLCQLVSEGFRIKAVYRSEQAKNALQPIFDFYSLNIHEIEQQVTWCQGDISDKIFTDSLVSGADYVCHCAAAVSFDRRDLSRLYQTNVAGTENIVNACLAQQIRKLIHISSIATLGQPEEGCQIDESCHLTTLKNRSVYSTTKYLAEMAVWRGYEEGLPMAIVNPSVILGPGLPQSGTPRLFEMIHKGFPFYIYGTNGFVDVRDVAKAIIWLLYANISGERFVLNADNVTYKRLFTLMAEGFGLRAPRYLLPVWLLRVGVAASMLAGFVSRRSPAVNNGIVEAAKGTYFYSSEKWKRFSGSGFVPLEKTITETCQFLHSFVR